MYITVTVTVTFAGELLGVGQVKIQKTLVDNMNDEDVGMPKGQAVIVFSAHNNSFVVNYFSQSIFRLLGLSEQSVFLIEHAHHDFIVQIEGALQRSKRQSTPLHHDFRCEVDGVTVHYDIDITPIKDLNEHTLYSVEIEQYQAGQFIDQQQYFRHELLVHNAHDCILVIDNASKIQVFNKAAQLMFGYELHEVLGHAIEMLIPKSARYSHSTQVKKFAESAQQSREMSSRRVVYGVRKNGEIFPAEISIAKMEFSTGTEFSAMVRDISLRAKLLEKLNYQAHTDSLTGLHNRFSIEDRLARYIEHINDNPNDDPLCLMLIDLDHFKKINDSHGHDMGDKVLCSFALSATKAMSVEHVFGRYGGEEFIIIVPEQAVEIVLEQAQNVRQTCELTWVNNINYTVSIGVAKYRYGETLQAFINRADNALYRAKDDGRNKVYFARDES